MSASHIVVPGPHEIETVDGLYLDLQRPDPAKISLLAIAHALSQTCRYGGSCIGYYSVAEHALMVASKLRRLGAPLDLQLAGLHHDDAEAFLGDIQRPMKPLIGPRYAELTASMDRAIWLAIAAPWASDGANLSWVPLYGMKLLHDPLLDKVDKWACGWEAKHIMPSQGAAWENVWLQDAVETDADDWEPACLSPVDAEWNFMDYHELLVEEHLALHKVKS